MPEPAERPMRRDGAANRERLLDAARRLFAGRGPDVPLEDVAQEAGVSRTTLYRHFRTREELAATVFGDTVAAIEERARQLRDRDDGIVELLDFVLGLQLKNRGFAPVLSAADIAWFTGLSARTVRAFEPLLDRGREAGTVHPHVGIDDVMMAFPMAAGVLNDRGVPGRGDPQARLRGMLHRALFTGPGPLAPGRTEEQRELEAKPPPVP